MSSSSLRDSSVRTLAWLGDAHFERMVRWHLAKLGDYPVTRLDEARARVVRAEAQADLLARIEPDLHEDEQAVVRRGMNAQVRGKGRAARDTKAYRAATGLEALVGWWACGDDHGEARLRVVLNPALAEMLATALAASAPIKRG
ncbi:MAG: ribonuclease III domain-containing protein [Nannocystaceae bacterium]